MGGAGLIGLVLDTSKRGLEALMRPWEADALRFVWSRGGGPATTREVWEHVHPLHGISRASVRLFLERMTGAGVLENRPTTGKGGMHGRYYPRLDEAAFRSRVAMEVMNWLLEAFPEEMRRFLENFKSIEGEKLFTGN